MARPRWPYRRQMVEDELPPEPFPPPADETLLLPPPPEPTEPLAPLPPDYPPPPGRPPAPPLLPPDGFPPDELPPGRNLWPWLVLLGILVVGGLLIAWAIGRGDDGQPTQSTVVVTTTPTTTVVARVAVPAVTGLSEDRARAALASAGLRARATRGPSERPAGTVVDQQPNPGTRLVRGSTVTLVVSTGPEQRTVEVPEVVGLTGTQAVSKLSALKLRARATSRFSAEPKGTVVAQDPVPGTNVEEGATVSIVVSKGDEQVSVPDVVGRAEGDARAAIRTAGLLASVFRVPNDQPGGTVVAQNPKGGERAARGARVRINVSEGPPPATTAPPPTTTAPPTTTTVVTTTVATTTTTATTTTAPTTTTTTTTTPTTTALQPATVPDTVGLSIGAARRTLRAAHLVAAVVYINANLPANTVIAQFPRAGTSVKRGSGVRINVSLGRKPKPQQTVPGVTGQDEQTAISQLEDAGLVAEVVDRETADPSEEGVVLDQDPAGESRAPAGSSVTLYVGRYVSG